MAIPVKNAQVTQAEYVAELDNVKQTEIDVPEMQALINESVCIIRKAFRSKGIPAKEKRDKALQVIGKVISGQLNIKHDVGDNFLSLVKEIHDK